MTFFPADFGAGNSIAMLINGAIELTSDNTLGTGGDSGGPAYLQTHLGTNNQVAYAVGSISATDTTREARLHHADVEGDSAGL